jgi:hypothetical protein
MYVLKYLNFCCSVSNRVCCTFIQSNWQKYWFVYSWSSEFFNVSGIMYIHLKWIYLQEQYVHIYVNTVWPNIWFMLQSVHNDLAKFQYNEACKFEIKGSNTRRLFIFTSSCGWIINHCSRLTIQNFIRIRYGLQAEGSSLYLHLLATLL